MQETDDLRDYYDRLTLHVAAALQARFDERDRIEDRLHARPLLGDELEQLEAEVDAELAALALPAWRVEAIGDIPWVTWRQGDTAAFLAVVDWALDEGVLAFEDEIPLCRAQALLYPPATGKD